MVVTSIHDLTFYNKFKSVHYVKYSVLSSRIRTNRPLTGLVYYHRLVNKNSVMKDQMTLFLNNLSKLANKKFDLLWNLSGT